MDEDKIIDGLRETIEEFKLSVDVAYDQFAVFVGDVIAGRLKDINMIEHTMDYMSIPV